MSTYTATTNEVTLGSNLVYDSNSKPQVAILDSSYAVIAYRRSATVYCRAVDLSDLSVGAELTIVAGRRPSLARLTDTKALITVTGNSAYDDADVYVITNSAGTLSKGAAETLTGSGSAEFVYPVITGLLANGNRAFAVSELSYGEGSYSCYAHVISISGTTPLETHAEILSSDQPSGVTCVRLSDNSVAVVTGVGADAWIVYNIQATSLTKGQDNTTPEGDFSAPDCVYLSDTKFLVEDTGTVYAVEITGGSDELTFGDPVTLDSTSSDEAIAGDSSVVLGFGIDEVANRYNHYLQPITESGRVLTLGTEQLIYSDTDDVGRSDADYLSGVWLYFKLPVEEGGQTALLAKITETLAVFYSGTGSLTQRATLSTSDVARGGMVVRADDDETVVVASGSASDSVVVEQSTTASTYATWTDLTGTHPQGAVKSIKEL